MLKLPNISETCVTYRLLKKTGKWLMVGTKLSLNARKPKTLISDLILNCVIVSK